MSTPVWRNRNFVLFETGRFLSSFGSSLSTIAYPLLVLSLTHSPAKAGLVTFARSIPQPVFSLVAGAAADRGNRRRQMLVADGIRFVALATLGTLVLVGSAHWWLVAIVGLIEGVGSTTFMAASAGVLPAVVPRHQLPDAIGARRVWGSTVFLAGPPIGGALFQVGRAVPFLTDAVSYLFSSASIIRLRTPFQEPREPETTPFRARLVEGIRYTWARPFLRTCALLYGLGNPLMAGILLALVVIGRDQGLTGGQIGLLTAALGASSLLGSLLSPLARRFLSIRTIMLLEFTSWFGAWLFVAWPNVYSLLALIVPFGLTAPITDSVVDGYRIAMTPDRLLGRVETARTTIAQLALPFGPLVAGVLLEHVTARITIALFAASALGLFVWGALSPAIRSAPSLSELETAGTLPA
ncbi:MAG TPA: MFS transporter [Gaiellaceae bacterium]|nr:MFS transporter [Gaiellaceae bacterium]